MQPLPLIRDVQAFNSLLRRPGQWVGAIATICEKHGLSGPFAQSENGSSVVFLSEDHCIKLHPPLPGFLESHHCEAAALRCIGDGLRIPTPQLLIEDALGEWTYLVSTRLRGRSIDAVWDELDTNTRVALATQLGHAIRELHQLSAEGLAAVCEPWQEFRKGQQERGLDAKRQRGLSPERSAEVTDFLRRFEGGDEPTKVSSLLHTEIGPSHVLVDEGRVTGLIDFGDARVGDPEYDLAPVGMFVTRGDPVAFGSFCAAYGIDAAALADPARPARLLRHALLHRYGTLAWYLDVLSPPAGSLEQLATHWFGVS